MLTPRVHHLLLLSGLTSACVPGRPAPVSPVQSTAVAEARAELGVAAGDRDLEAFFSRLAPGATLITGTDTFDLRTLVTRAQAQLAPDASTELWFSEGRLRDCDRWIFEAGGRVGVNFFRPGTAAEVHQYRYVVAWTTDTAGRAMIANVAVVRTRDAGRLRIPGCRPSARELLEQRRGGIALMPGSGFMSVNARGDVESAIRGRLDLTGLFDAQAGYPAAGQSSSPTVASVWVRVAPHLRLEAVATLGTLTTWTSGADTVNYVASSLRLEQRWAAVTATWSWRDARIGIGPLIVRESWHVGADELRFDPLTGSRIPVYLGDAASVRTRAGLFTQIVMTLPLTGNLYADLRGFVTALSPTVTPRTSGVPPMRASTSGAGFGIAFGAAF